MPQDKYSGFSKDLDTLLGKGFGGTTAPTERDRPQSERLSDANKRAKVSATVSSNTARTIGR